MKVVERPGPALMAGISANNPFRRQLCLREKCPYVRAGKECNESCYKQGILYTAECTLCSKDSCQTLYIGESSRSLYTRSNQHLGDFRRAVQGKEGASSFYKDHISDCHPEQSLEVEVAKNIDWKVLDTRRDPLSRQTMEAVLIQQAINCGKLEGLAGVHITSMNRKGEYFSARERWARNNNFSNS